MNGIIIIDKPADFTSFDVVAVVRGCMREKKTGHSGTLDPMATGVLPVLLGSATKVQDLLPDTDKEYEAEFRLGMTTDTLDIWGRVLSETVSDISEDEIKALLPKFTGEIMQTPPMYSAVFKDGVRLYELARKGIEVEREARAVNIPELSLVEFDREAQRGRLRISCSKGTYIRVICDDIGKALGCGCIMTSLVRTRACGFTLDDAVSLDTVRALAPEGPSRLQEFVRPVDSVFSGYPLVRLSEKQSVRFRNGAPLMLSRLKDITAPEDGALYRVYAQNGDFLGLGIISTEKEELSVKKRF